MASKAKPKLSTKHVTPQTVTVLGAGAWGTALSLVLARNGHQVWLWSREATHREALRHDRENRRYLPSAVLPDNLDIIDHPTNHLQQSDQVLIAVPSEGFANIIATLATDWPKHTGLIWATKGFAPDTGMLLHEIAEHYLPNAAHALITGPSFATEVSKHQPTTVVAASTDLSFAQMVQQLFQAPHFRVYVSNDIIGAELGGAVKNVLAIAVGIAEGLGFGMNAQAALMTRGLAEMMRLGQTLGAQNETLMGLSGLGDLILTCSDNQSRNRRFGLALGQGQHPEKIIQDIGQVVEGMVTAKTVYQLAQQHGVEMPISTQVYRVLYENLAPFDAVGDLLGRTSGLE